MDTNQKLICQCGCGQVIPPKKHHNRYTPKFIRGHSNRTRKIKPFDVEKAFWNRVYKRAENECWDWEGYLMPNGYGQLKVKERNVYAHRFSFKLHFGFLPDHLLVCHKCDNRNCVNPNHLFLGTHKENTRDMDLKGRRVTKPGTQKITRTDAKQIRALSKDGIHVNMIAEKYKLKPCTIRNIIAGRIWKNIG